MERNIYFICLCGKHLAVNEAGVGQEINCPDCGKTLIIPRSDREWGCSCGAPILIPANLSMFGESINCVECNAIHKVPEIEEPSDAPEPEPMPVVEPSMPISIPPQQNRPISFDHSMKCPSCGANITHDAVICTNCGLNLRTDNQIRTPNSKKCPFCAEEIQDAAIKCKHCGEFLDGATRPSRAGKSLPWYFRTSFIVIAICCVGPLALPLIWWRPQTALAWKIALTIVILILSWFLFQATMKSVGTIKEYYKLLDGL